MAESYLARQCPRTALINTMDLTSNGLRQALALLDALALTPSADLAKIGRGIVRDHLELLDPEHETLQL